MNMLMFLMSLWLDYQWGKAGDANFKAESQSRGVWNWGPLNWSWAPFGALFGLISGISNKHKHIERKHAAEAVNNVGSTLQTVAESKKKKEKTQNAMQLIGRVWLLLLGKFAQIIWAKALSDLFQFIQTQSASASDVTGGRLHCSVLTNAVLQSQRDIITAVNLTS